jgi:hypothetical protein
MFVVEVDGLRDRTDLAVGCNDSTSAKLLDAVEHDALLFSSATT